MTSKNFGLAAIALFAVCVTGGYLQDVQAYDDDGIVSKPFKVSASGTVSHIPIPTAEDPTPEPGVHTADGTATQMGLHSSVGSVQVDKFLTATTAEFSSAVPVIFTNTNGEDLAFDYKGIATLTPQVDEQGNFIGFTSTWDAIFTPAFESNTGKYENVVGGSFRMIATTARFLPGDRDISFSWEGDGALDWSKD